MERTRLDKLLVDRGCAPTRQKAQAMILAGEVFVDGRRVDKPGTPIPSAAPLEIRSGRRIRVGRAGEKLEAALERFGLAVEGRLALDIGASVGGFTECLLNRGASRVIALDVGKGQLDQSLRGDPRVRILDGMNARYLRPGDLSPDEAALDLIVCDVSFISLRLILPAVARVLTRGDAVVLVKPQFEAGRGKVGKGGVVRDPKLHREAIEQVLSEAQAIGFDPAGVIRSPIRGPAGNVEFLAWLRLEHDPSRDVSNAINDAISASLA